MTLRPSQHRVPLGDGPFDVWRGVCLRGTGLPYSLLASLTAKEAAAAADRLLSAEAKTEELTAAAIQALRATRSDDAEVVDRLRTAEKHVRKGRIPQPTGTAADAAFGAL